MQQAEAISRLVDAVEVKEFTKGQLIVVKVTPLNKCTLIKSDTLPERHSLLRYSYLMAKG